VTLTARQKKASKMINPNNPYVQRIIDKVNSYQENLWDNFEQVPLLETRIGHRILQDFIELACQSQHIGNIEIGRYGILALPRGWVLQHIEILAEPLLQSEDEWEYRRLIEVYWSLDKDLTRKLAKQGLTPYFCANRGGFYSF